MLTDPAALFAAWIAAVMGRPDVATHIMLFAPTPQVTILRVVARRGRLLDSPEIFSRRSVEKP
jgi:hypothetical protein